MIDRFDWEIIEFVVSWANYGGPRDEDTFPLFGMDAQRLLVRFSNVVLRLRAGCDAALTLEQYKLLRRAASLNADLNRQGQTPGTTKSGNSPLDLSASAGEWFQHQGIWHWQESESSRSMR
ncbi:hypothetical protein A5699_22040 [Mycobacterium sp. E802]|nr:hypothetical protein A5699_22040 [Mycobacterium sp. E802]